MGNQKNRITIESSFPIDYTTSRARESILLLPENWTTQGDEPIYRATVEPIRKLYDQNGIPCETFTPLTVSTHLRDERSLDWVAPTLLVSGQLLMQNPSAVDLALNTTADYVMNLFKGLKKDPKVKLSIIQTSAEGKDSRKLRYEGPVSGLSELNNVLSNFDPKD